MHLWSKRLFFTTLFLLVGYVLAVQVLRWIAFGDEERAALAVMDVQPPAPAGESGFKYLAYSNRVVPDEALDETLAADVAAFDKWHADYYQVLVGARSDAAPPTPPSHARFPERPVVQVPEPVCGLRESDCLERLRGSEAQVRDWLEADAARLDMARRALSSDHLTNPYQFNVASPLGAFQLLRLPLNDIAVQALEGDVVGALPRACALLGDARRHLRNDGMLVDKLVFASLTEAASGLVLSIRQADPALPMPGSCAEALAPVQMQDFQVCDALRTEFAMISELSRQMQRGYSGWRLPGRWVLYSAKLQRGWTAIGYAPYCTEEGQAAIARGELPTAPVRPFDRSSIDFWAAPISYILSSISLPAYGGYQERLLDHAAALRTHLDALARLPAAQDAEAEVESGPEADSGAAGA